MSISSGMSLAAMFSIFDLQLSIFVMMVWSSLVSVFGRVFRSVIMVWISVRIFLMRFPRLIHWVVFHFVFIGLFFLLGCVVWLVMSFLRLWGYCGLASS